MTGKRAGFLHAFPEVRRATYRARSAHGPFKIVGSRYGLGGEEHAGYLPRERIPSVACIRNSLQGEFFAGIGILCNVEWSTQATSTIPPGIPSVETFP